MFTIFLKSFFKGYSTLKECNVQRVILKAKRGNALSSDCLKDLIDQIKLIRDSTKVVILTSHDDFIFSSGHDLSEFSKATNFIKPQQIFERLIELTTLIQNLPVPVIAEVRGVAAAAGCQLIASCDIVTASENATFSTPGVKNGIFCNTPGVAIYHHTNMSPKHLAKMLFTGESITANEAYIYGLVSKVFPNGKLEQGTLEIAAQISRNSRPILAMGKKCFYSQMEKNTSDAYKLAVSTMVENVKLDDAQEGIKAFFEKRLPKWI